MKSSEESVRACEDVEWGLTQSWLERRGQGACPGGGHVDAKTFLYSIFKGWPVVV